MSFCRDGRFFSRNLGTLFETWKDKSGYNYYKEMRKKLDIDKFDD